MPSAGFTRRPGSVSGATRGAECSQSQETLALAIRWVNLIVVAALLLAIAPAPVSADSAKALPTPPPPRALLAQDVAIGSEGGTVALPVGELILPPGALAASTAIGQHQVELRLAEGLLRFHPIDLPVRVYR